MKLGKHPATPKPTDFKFSDYKIAANMLPLLPQHYGFDQAVKDWGMLGNDQYGDCVWAGACHEHMLLTATESPVRPSPTEAHFTDQNALSAYSAVTGFKSSDPSTDQGTNVHDAMSYRQHTGIRDSHGNTHKIGAYLSLDPGNMQEVFEALYLLGCVGIGIQFPQSAMDQFNAGVPWDVVKGSPIEGGHYIPVVSKWYDSYVKIVTWGQLHVMTDNFYKTYCDEAWAYVSQDLLNSKGLTARGFDIDQLNADLKEL